MFPLPLLIEPRPVSLARVRLLHLAALAALFLAELPPLAQLAGIGLLGLSLARLNTAPAAVRLRAHRDGRLEIWRDTAWQRVALQAASVALPGLIVLRWREGRRRHSLVLTAAALPEDEHRRLRVWLRWKARFGAAEVAPPFDSGIPGRLH